MLKHLRNCRKLNKMEDLDFNEIINFQQKLIEVCNEMYNEIGGAGPEKIYKTVLKYELIKLFHQYHIDEEVSVPVYYKHIQITTKIMDLVIYKDTQPFIVLELKWLPSNELDAYQLSNYMKHFKCKYGFMINFKKIGGTHPTNFVAKVFDTRTGLRIPVEIKLGTVRILRFENLGQEEVVEEAVEAKVVEEAVEEEIDEIDEKTISFIQNHSIIL